MTVIAENHSTFFKRLEPFMAPSTLLDVQLAYTLAKYGHRAQLRKELDENGDQVRYFEHVRRVAIVLIDEVRVVRPEMVICCLMHDVIEDAPNLPPALIERCFGTDVVGIIKVLSKDPAEGYLDRFRMSPDWRPYAIKACDRLDNLRSLDGSTQEFKAKQVAETRGKYYGLFDRMVLLSPTELSSQLQRLRDSVMKETERQATLLEMNAKLAPDGFIVQLAERQLLVLCVASSSLAGPARIH